ncbi:MAG: hypothetical protein RH862_11820 [Leptospiraceae bacterium]
MRLSVPGPHCGSPARIFDEPLFWLALADLQVRAQILNNSGSAVAYTLHPTAGCADAAMLTFSVANGETSEYQSVTTTHTAAIGRNGRTCSARATFPRGSQITVTDTGSGYTFSQPLSTSSDSTQGLMVEPAPGRFAY